MRRAALIIASCLVLSCAGGDDGSTGVDADAPVSSSPSSTTSTTTLRPPTPEDPPEPPVPTIGELEIPCRSSELVEVPVRPGVTDEAITIGTGTDRGGIATAGAGRGVVEMMEVLVDHCNANGGLLGRSVRVEEYDAAAVEADDRVARACGEVSALVGHVFYQYLEAESAAAACGLPSIPTEHALVPSARIDLHGLLAGVFAATGNGGDVALVAPDTPAAAEATTARLAAIAFGEVPLRVVSTVSYPVDDPPDWPAVVNAAREGDAGQVHLVGGCDHAVAPFLTAADAAGWEPVVVTTAAAYDPACLDLVNASRLLVEVPFLPVEDGSAAPAISAHAELLDRVGAPLTGHGVLAASAFWRWASLAEDCLVVPDPECVADAVDRQGEWTAGGLHRGIQASGASPGCAVVLAIDAGAFVRRLPEEPGTYDCTEGLSVEMP